MAGRIDARVAAVLDRQKPNNNNNDSDEDEDALISALEDDEHDSHALVGLREQRLQQLHAEVSRAKLMRESEHGTYTEIKDEKQVLDITTSTKLCVVHFMKPDFNRCRVMDGKLASLAAKHFDTRIVSINVENAPFLVAKLKIQVLPCVIAFVNGVAADRILGFEGLGRRPDDFTLRDLELRLLSSGVLVRAKVGKEDERQSNGHSGMRQQVFADDEGDDWD